MEAVASSNEDLQLAAAGCLANIRRLVLRADKIKYQDPKIKYCEIKKKHQVSQRRKSIAFKDLNLISIKPSHQY